jgi:hypothetical protein
LKIFFTQTGANDPDFNLRAEPSYILRTNGKKQTFFSVIEIHGDFSPITEIAHQSYPEVQSVHLMQDNNDFQAYEISCKQEKYVFMICKKDYSESASHSFVVNGGKYEWKGPYYFSNKH